MQYSLIPPSGVRCCKTIQQALHVKHTEALSLMADRPFTFISTDQLPEVLISLILCLHPNVAEQGLQKPVQCFILLQRWTFS